MHPHFTKYTFGDLVYLKTDVNQEQWIVTDIDLKPSSVVIYTIACGSMIHTAYDFEITLDPNQGKRLGYDTVPAE